MRPIVLKAGCSPRCQGQPVETGDGKTLGVFLFHFGNSQGLYTYCTSTVCIYSDEVCRMGKFIEIGSRLERLPMA